MPKIYEVFVTDLWNNNYLMGFYKNLDDSINDINSMLDDKHKIEKGDIKEYASTFDMCFGTCIGDILMDKGQLSEEDDDFEDLSSMMVRGFILDSKKLLEIINHLNKEERL